MMKHFSIASVSVIAAVIAVAPPAHADTEQSSAEQAVRDAYIQFQKGCTPATPPQFESITWDFFYPPGTDLFGRPGGAGRINDASPGLGGPFAAVQQTGGPVPHGAIRVDGWDVVFEFC